MYDLHLRPNNGNGAQCSVPHFDLTILRVCYGCALNATACMIHFVDEVSGAVAL